jgi:hypothetical protein
MTQLKTQISLSQNGKLRSPPGISKQHVNVHSYKLLKQGIWAYFLLLIFEGALRKWFLPSLAAPLLIIRDPLAFWIIVVAAEKGLFPKTSFVAWMILIGIFSIFTTLFLGHGNLKVTIYGARVLLIHFPLIFAIGKILNRADVIKIGKVIVWLTIPMTILIILQFYSPQTAWVNRGLGGVIEDQGFQGALGHFRPSATFSFITGTYLFFGLAACFIFYFWFSTHLINTLLLTLATFCLLAAIPISISRTLFFEVSLSIAFFSFGASIKSRYFSRMVATLVIGTAIVVILSKTAFFEHAMDTFFSRFTDASNVEGGIEGTLGDRFLGGLISAIKNSGQLPFFGYGLGMGTNVGSQLLAGSRHFLLHEEEWGRIIDEQGPLMGQAVVFIRVALAIRLAFEAYKNLIKGDMLPWMLLSFGFLAVAQGNWSQPTSLGFCTLIGGLIIASFNMPRNNIK